MSSRLQHAHTQRTAQSGLGGRRVQAQTSLDFATVGSYIDDLHAALQCAVETYGGVVALAAAMGKPVPDISLRVRRAQDSKGQVQRATFDLLAYVIHDSNARMVFVNSLLRRWHYRETEPVAHQATPEQALNGLLSVLEEAGEVGGDVLRRAASRIGVDVAALRRSR